MLIYIWKGHVKRHKIMAFVLFMVNRKSCNEKGPRFMAVHCRMKLSKYI